MKTKAIDTEDATFLATRPEDHFFDRKGLDVSGKQVQKVAVAFANADGGEFVIGVKDAKQESDPDLRWSGAAEVEKFNPQLQALSEVTPPLDLRYEIVVCDGKPGSLLRVFVEKSSSVHSTSDNSVYQRLGAQSLKITDPQRLVELSFAKGAQTYEDQILRAVAIESIVETEHIKSFLGGFSPRTDPLEYVTNENLVDDRSWEPRVCGALLFHNNPPAVVPKRCGAKVARYETREDDPEREHLKGVSSFEGPIYDLIKETVDKVTDVLSSVSIWTTEGLKQVDYPPEALWEVIVNAFIHRDYSQSDDVTILIYNDRVEVKSPGRLPGYVTVENILDVRLSRNPKLVRTLSRYKNAPNKDLGEGLNTAFQRMKDWKLKPPIIEEQNNYLIVTLPHTPLASPSELILEFLREHSEITNRQAREITGIRSENLVKVEFYKLRDGGLIEMIPEKKGPAAAWRMKKKL